MDLVSHEARRCLASSPPLREKSTLSRFRLHHDKECIQQFCNIFDIFRFSIRVGVGPQGQRPYTGKRILFDTWWKKCVLIQVDRS